MRIAHLGKYYPPHRGGIESVVAGLCRGLARRGIGVTALASNTERADSSEELDGVRVMRVGRQFELRSQPLNLGLVRAIQRLDFDILHVHTPNPLGALAALRAIEPTQAVVVTHHSDIVRQRLLGVAGAEVHAALYRRAAAVVVATPRHVQYSRLVRRFESRTRVIHFGIARANAGPWPFPTRLPSAWHDAPFALFVGRLVYYKGVGVLLDAMRDSPELRLAIVGEGPLRAELEAKAAASALGERVAFLGQVSDAELHSLYAHCGFLVLPSIAPSEAFGMVQLEAMAAGRPVISTNLRSGVPYVNQHGHTGLIVEPGDSAGLARALRRLASDEALTNLLGKQALARVEAEFAEETILDQWVALYDEVLRAGSAST